MPPEIQAVKEYGSQGVIAILLFYFFLELRGLKGRVRKLEGLEVIVERFRNYYDICRHALLASVEFHRTGDKPTETQMKQWEAMPTEEQLMQPQTERRRGRKRVNREGDENAGSE